MSKRQTTGQAARVPNGRATSSSAADVEKQISNTSDPLAAQASQYVARMDARSRFMSATASLAWRMAIAVLVPVIIGVQIDKHFKTSPSYTLAAVFLGVGISVWIIWDTITKITNEQAADDLAKANLAKKDAKHV